MKKKNKNLLAYSNTARELSEDIGISINEIKYLMDIALSSSDPKNINYGQLKLEIKTFIIINIFSLVCKL